MEFSQLRIFQAVAEEGSVTRAAERLHRVPSNLSTRLRQLEEQLGVELFLRERQRLQLSPAGKVLLDYANRMSALRDEALGAVRGGQPAGDFVLGTMYSTAATHLPALLARYHQAYPQVNLQVRAAPSGELLEGLLNHTLDAALVDGPPSLAGLDGVPLCDEQLVLTQLAERVATKAARPAASPARPRHRSATVLPSPAQPSGPPVPTGRSRRCPGRALQTPGHPAVGGCARWPPVG